MKQAPDRNAFAQLVETLNSSLGLQDLDGNAFVDQYFECLWTDHAVPSENLILWIRSRKENRIMIETDGDLRQTFARLYVGLLSFA